MNDDHQDICPSPAASTLMHQSSSKLNPPLLMDFADNIAVVTANASESESAVGATNMSHHQRNCAEPTVTHALATDAPRLKHVSTSNCCNSIILDEHCIAVNSGTSDGFGDTDAPGMNRVLAQCGITKCSAAGNCKQSISEDKSELPLPPAACCFHATAKGDNKHPLLSVGNTCDARCDAQFNECHCSFCKVGQELL